MNLQRVLLILVIFFAVAVFGMILVVISPLVISYTTLPSQSALEGEPELVTLGFGDPKGPRTKLPPSNWVAPSGLECAACAQSGPDRNACNSMIASYVSVRKYRRRHFEHSRFRMMMTSIAEVIVLGINYSQRDLFRLYAADQSQALGYDSIEEACTANFGVSCSQLTHEDGVMLGAVFVSGVPVSPGETPPEGLAAIYSAFLKACPKSP